MRVANLDPDNIRMVTGWKPVYLVINLDDRVDWLTCDVERVLWQQEAWKKMHKSQTFDLFKARGISK